MHERASMIRYTYAVFLHVFTSLLGTELGSTKIFFLRIKNCNICMLIKHVR